MAYSSAEVKSGVFIVVAATLMFGLIFIVSGVMAGSTHTYQLQFGYIGGLEANAPVFFAGHEVGKVDAIKVHAREEKPVRLVVRVADHVKLRDQAQVYIGTLGLMGEKVVEIEPGPLEATLVEAGGLIVGNDPVPGYQLIAKMDRMADQMDALHVSLNPILESSNKMLEESQDDVTAMIANFKEASENIKEMTADLKRRPWRLVRKGKPNED